MVHVPMSPLQLGTTVAEQQSSKLAPTGHFTQISHLPLMHDCPGKQHFPPHWRFEVQVPASETLTAHVPGVPPALVEQCVPLMVQGQSMDAPQPSFSIVPHSPINLLEQVPTTQASLVTTPLSFAFPLSGAGTHSASTQTSPVGQSPLPLHLMTAGDTQSACMTQTP